MRACPLRNYCKRITRAARVREAFTRLRVICGVIYDRGMANWCRVIVVLEWRKRRAVINRCRNRCAYIHYNRVLRNPDNGIMSWIRGATMIPSYGSLWIVKFLHVACNFYVIQYDALSMYKFRNISTPHCRRSIIPDTAAVEINIILHIYFSALSSESQCYWPTICGNKRTDFAPSTFVKIMHQHVAKRLLPNKKKITY